MNRVLAKTELETYKQQRQAKPAADPVKSLNTQATQTEVYTGKEYFDQSVGTENPVYTNNAVQVGDSRLAQDSKAVQVSGPTLGHRDQFVQTEQVTYSEERRLRLLVEGRILLLRQVTGWDRLMVLLMLKRILGM